MPKRSIRQRLLSERRRCPTESCLLWSRHIQARFLDDELYRRAGCLGLYSPLHNEVQTEVVAEQARRDGKRLVYPRVYGEILEFCQVNVGDGLAAGAFGILEPAGEPVPLAQIDLLVVPGVAFDLGGHRLGFGKGYYDRTLADCHPALERVGFAYEFQVVEQLPAADHDCRLTCLVTEHRTLHFPDRDRDSAC
jgi:5-formyltetrahydrofolate cyclo-ligase